MILVSPVGFIPNFSSSGRITIGAFHYGMSKKFDELMDSGDRLGKFDFPVSLAILRQSWVDCEVLRADV